MGIFKKSSLAGQSIDVRSFDQRMAPQAADPVILVVDGNKQNIWFLRSLQNVCKGQHQQHAYSNQFANHSNLLPSLTSTPGQFYALETCLYHTYRANRIVAITPSDRALLLAIKNATITG